MDAEEEEVEEDRDEDGAEEDKDAPPAPPLPPPGVASPGRLSKDEVRLEYTVNSSLALSLL